MGNCHPVRSARVCSRVTNVAITAQNVQGIVRNIGGEIRWTFRRYRYSSVFPSVRDLFKDLLPDSPKIAVINFDLTIIFILPPFPGRGISRFLASIAVAETLLISTIPCLHDLPLSLRGWVGIEPTTFGLDHRCSTD